MTRFAAVNFSVELRSAGCSRRIPGSMVRISSTFVPLRTSAGFFDSVQASRSEACAPLGMPGHPKRSHSHVSQKQRNPSTSLRAGVGTPLLVETLKIVILSEAKDLCTPRQLHRSFAAKNAAQDDKVCGGQF